MSAKKISVTPTKIQTINRVDHILEKKPLAPYRHSIADRLHHDQFPSRREGTPLYGLYRYVRPQRVWFFRCFGHK